MPPKKDSKDVEKSVLLGRLSTNLKVGIVGVPNVGYDYNLTDGCPPIVGLVST